jgi:hypothetical protein
VTKLQSWCTGNEWESGSSTHAGHLDWYTYDNFKGHCSFTCPGVAHMLIHPLNTISLYPRINSSNEIRPQVPRNHDLHTARLLQPLPECR